MTTNLLVTLALAVMAVEGNDILAIGNQGERGYAQGKQIVAAEALR